MRSSCTALLPRAPARSGPYTGLHYPRRLPAHRERLQGVERDARGDLVSVRRWWIAPADRR